MFITVQLAPQAARQMSRGSLGVTGDLKQMVAELGVELQPLHPGVTDPELATQFYAEVDDSIAEDTCARLLENPAVVAAYSKPAGSPPDGVP